MKIYEVNNIYSVSIINISFIWFINKEFFIECTVLQIETWVGS